ncbi:MAG: hypothetical protein JST01_02255 [Cyanobacteria bacterium SZAS TMP-1]|nr:hypothetical protein [Cyanobacteria bacterium SZAS TMP-1]
MQVIQCQICQVTNEEAAPFCRECGGRLQSAAPPMPAQAAEPEAAPQPEPPKRPRLHSPILGGGGDIDEDDSPAPSFKRVKSGQGGSPMSQSQSGTGGQKRGGLRSPLLGGDVDDMDEEDMAPRGKGGFGAFAGGKPKKTEFPHRHSDGDLEAHDAGASTGGQKTTGARGGLRSPLLGGGGDDEDYDDQPSAGRAPRPAKPGRLRSPILGGGGDDYYDEEVFDEVVEEIDDPTVLRSPLLAVRTPKAHAAPPQGQQKPQPQAPAPQPAVAEKSAPFVQGPYTQASGSAPNFALSAGNNANAGPNYQPFPPAPGPQPGAAAGIAAPQAPTQAPAYSPPPAPPAPAGMQSQPSQPAQSMQNMPSMGGDAYNYGYQNPQSQPVQSQSAGYQAPLPPAPAASSPLPTRPNQQALPPNPGAMAPEFSAEPTPQAPPKASPKATGTKMDAGVSEDEQPKLKGMRGSKLLGEVSDDPIGPLDRRSRFDDRRTTPRGSDRRGTQSSLAALHKADEIEADDLPVGRSPYTGGMSSGGSMGGGSAANPMAPLLMAFAVIALIAKGAYIASFLSKPDVLAANMPATIDQVTTMLVLIGLILFAMKASKKN